MIYRQSVQLLAHHGIRAESEKVAQSLTYASSLEICPHRSITLVMMAAIVSLCKLPRCLLTILLLPAAFSLEAFLLTRKRTPRAWLHGGLDSSAQLCKEKHGFLARLGLLGASDTGTMLAFDSRLAFQKKCPMDSDLARSAAYQLFCG